MPYRPWPYPQSPDNMGERAGMIERDVYHLDVRVTELAQAHAATSNRLHALSARSQQNEIRLNQLDESHKHLEHLAEKIPDLESIARVIGWILGTLKVMAGFAILAAALANERGAEALKAFFG